MLSLHCLIFGVFAWMTRCRKVLSSEINILLFIKRSEHLTQAQLTKMPIEMKKKTTTTRGEKWDFPFIFLARVQRIIHNNNKHTHQNCLFDGRCDIHYVINYCLSFRILIIPTHTALQMSKLTATTTKQKKSTQTFFPRSHEHFLNVVRLLHVFSTKCVYCFHYHARFDQSVWTN